MSPFVWMFISSYEKLRHFIISEKCITSLVQLEYSGFDGATVPICTYTFENSKLPRYKGSYIRLSDFRGAENQGPKTLEAIQNPACGWFFTATAEDFKKIPGSPVAYWVSDNVRNIFAENPPLGNVANAAVGLQTGDNNLFLRLWFEVNVSRIGFGMSSCDEAFRSAKKWFPYNKGGEFRKWYGNQEYVVNWEKDGQEIRNFFDENGRLRSRPQNTVFYFRESVSWSDVTSAVNAFRFYPKGFIHDIKGQSLFGFNSQEKKHILSFLNLKFIYRLTKILNPSLSFQVGNLNQLPHLDFCQDSSECIMLEKSDWDAYETSWDFQSLPLLRPEYRFSQPPGGLYRRAGCLAGHD